jgi:hypothetical protein
MSFFSYSGIVLLMVVNNESSFANLFIYVKLNIFTFLAIFPFIDKLFDLKIFFPYKKISNIEFMHDIF